jgi:uncharacterized protein (DUF1778 family)
MATVDLTPAEPQKAVFQNFDRPFTELLGLLTAGDRAFRKYDDTTLEAIKQHASNTLDTLENGIQGVGKLLYENAVLENGANLSAIRDVSWFVSEMANLAEALRVIESNTCYELHERALQRAARRIDQAKRPARAVSDGISN